MSRLNIILVVGLLLLSLSSFAGTLESREPVYEFTISKDSEVIEVTSYTEREYDTKDKTTVKYINTEIHSSRNKINLQNVRVEEVKPSVSIRDGRSSMKGSDIITINDIELDLGIIIIEKYYDGEVSPLHSKDGINWNRVNITYEQNLTHIWFNVTEFSSWTSTLPHQRIINELGSKEIDLKNFADYTLGDYIRIAGINDPENSATILLENDAGAVDRWIRDLSLDNIIRIQLTNSQTSPANIMTLTPGDVLYSYTDEWNFVIFDEQGFAQDNQFVDITVRDYVYPVVDTRGVTSITTSSASIRGRVIHNDYMKETYRGWGINRARFRWREDGDTTWTYESYVTAVDGATFSKPLSGLLEDTTYEYEVQYQWENPVDSVTEYLYSGVSTFTTDSSIATPSVQTLSPSSITDTTTTLRGVADFDGYTGTVTGLLCYRETGVGSFVCDAGQTISDGTTFIRELTGLTTDTGYEYVASITWDSESDTGSVVSFTTNAVSGESDFTEDLVLYYKLDETSGTVATDSHSTNDGTANNARVFTSEIAGKINTGADFTGGDDYISTSLSLNAHTTSYTFSVWINPSSIQRKTLFSTDESNTAPRGFQLQIYDTGHINVFTGVEGIITDTTEYLTTGMQHVVFVLNKNSVSIYLDGNLLKTASTSFGDTNKDLIIGSRNIVSEFYDGFMDEVGIWGKALSSDEITELYNDGNALSYDDFETEVDPTTETLTVTNKASTWAVLSQVPSFNSYTESVDLFYQIIKSDDAIGDPTTWTWNVIPSDYTGFGTGFTATDGTLHQINMTNLDYDTEYYVQGAVSWTDGTFYSEYQTFVTDTPELPEVDTLGAIASDTNAVLRGRVLSLGDFTTVNAYIVMNGTEVFTVETSDFGAVDGILGHTQSPLEPLTQYCYIFGATQSWTGHSGFNNINVQGSEVCFNTTATGDPVINTLPATNILRESATLQGEIFDLGIHSEIPFWFRYSGLFTEGIVIPESFETDFDGWTVSGDVERVNTWSTDGDWSVYIPNANHIEKEIYVNESNPYIIFDVNLLDDGFNPKLQVCVDNLLDSSDGYRCSSAIHTITTIGESLDVNVSLEAYIGQEIKLQFISKYLLWSGVNSFAQIDNIRYTVETTFNDTVNTPEIPYTVEVPIGDNIKGLRPDTTYTFEAMTRIDDREISGGELEFTTLSLNDFIGATINEPFLNDKSHDYIELIINVNMYDVNESILSFNLYDSSMNLINTTVINVTESGNYNTVFTGLDSVVLYYYDASLQFQDDINETQSLTSTLYSTRTLDVYVTPTTLCVVDRLCIEISNRYLFSTLFIVGLTIVGLGLSVGSQFSQFGAEKILVYGITALSVILSIYMFEAEVMPPWMFLYLISGTIVIVFYYITRLATGGSVYG